MDHRSERPAMLDLGIRDIQRLTLQVHYHDARNIGDVVHFCDAKVTR